MLSGFFGSIKIADINLHQISQQQNYNKSNILERRYKNLNDAKIKFNCPTFKKLELDKGLIAISSFSGILEQEPNFEGINKIIIDNFESNIKQLYCQQANIPQSNIIENGAVKLKLVRFRSNEKEEQNNENDINFEGSDMLRSHMQQSIFQKNELDVLIKKVQIEAPELTEDKILFYFEVTGYSSDPLVILEYYYTQLVN